MSDAHLDPWCPVEIAPGVDILFGFAERHPLTGGQSWMQSSPIVSLDEDTGVARTQSGRSYSLGTRLEPTGEEALCALGILTGRAPAGRPGEDRERDVMWLTACKVARWCRAVCPPRTDAEAIRAFLATHRAAYMARRAGHPVN